MRRALALALLLALPVAAGGPGQAYTSGGNAIANGLAGQVAYYAAAHKLTGSSFLTFNGTDLILTDNHQVKWSVASLSAAGAVLYLGGNTTALMPYNAATADLGTNTVGWKTAYFSTASGSDALRLLTTGARAHLGGGTNDYLYSDGSWIYAHGGFQSDAILASLGEIRGYNGAGSPAFRVITNGAQIDFGAGASDYATSDGTTVTFASPLAWSLTADNVDVGNGSNLATATALPACATSNSVLTYDTATHAFGCSTRTHVIPVWNYCQGAYAADTDCLGGYVSNGETTLPNAVTCQTNVAGSGGTTAMQIQLWDVTAASAVATDTTHIACNLAAHTPTAINFGAVALTAGHVYVLREHTKGDCTTGATGLACTVNLTQ